MGVSFRNARFLGELKPSTAPLPRKLDKKILEGANLTRLQLDEKSFRWLLNENAMATEKLSERIRLFNQAIRDLEKLLP